MAHSQNVLLATDQSFDQEVLGSGGLALVDFWAEWCGPCKMLSPTIDALADQYAGKLKVYKMNVDENELTPTRFNVRGIPAVFIFKKGQIVDQIIGNQPRDVFVQAIERHLN